MRPLARSSLPFDSPAPSALSSPSSLASSSPPRSGTSTPRAAISSPLARSHSARLVVPNRRPVSQSASVLLGATTPGARCSGERGRGGDSLDERAAGGEAEGTTDSPVTEDDVSLGSVQVPVVEVEEVGADESALARGRLAEGGDLLTWMSGLGVAASPSTSKDHLPPSQHLAPPPTLPASSSATSLPSSFRFLETAPVPHLASSSASSTAPTTSSRAHSIFCPSRWRRLRAPSPAPPSPSPPSPPPFHPPTPEPLPVRGVRFAPSASSAPPSTRSLSPPPADWHLVSARALSDPNAQGQHAPRVQGGWGRWVVPRPEVKAWVRTRAVRREGERVAGPRGAFPAGGNVLESEEEDWVRSIGIELERAAREAAKEWDGSGREEQAG